MKYKAHIPVQSYGYIEVESDDIEEITREYNRYTETPVSFGGNEGFTEVKSFTGETILWNETLHEYRDLDGNKLMGGSTYAEQFKKPFDKVAIASVCEKAWGIKSADILDIWAMNAKASTDYGDAIHGALELVHKHGKSG